MTKSQGRENNPALEHFTDVDSQCGILEFKRN